MAKAENSSSEEPPPKKEAPLNRRQVSQAPPPLTPLPRGHAPPANTEPARPSAATVRALSHSFKVAAHHCDEIIWKGKSVKMVDQIQWTYETERWSEIARPALNEELAKCERAGMDTGEFRMQIKKRDTEYRLVCKLRNSRNDMASKSASLPSIPSRPVRRAARPQCTSS
jgi:hypothetical protein